MIKGHVWMGKETREKVEDETHLSHVAFSSGLYHVRVFFGSE